MIQLENIPQDLKYDGLFCCWKLTDRGKVPIDPTTNAFAKSNARNTFHSYKTTLNYLGNYLKYDADGRMTGGLGLGIFNGFSAIDIDHCFNDDGVLSDMARDIIDYCQSYTEISPSGKGIRIIFKTNYTGFDKTKYYTNNHKLGLEIYIEGATNKFVTLTGNSLLTGVDVCDVDIEYLLNKYMQKAPSTAPQVDRPTGHNTYDIRDFLSKDQKLYELWNAYADNVGQSETDLALCSKLAFYLQRDPEAINEAFISSPYFESKDQAHKNKWLVREDYSKNTIELAVDGCMQVYTPQQQRYDLNDTGNAHRFIDKFGADLHYNIDNKRWMIWNGAYWQTDIYNSVKNLAEIVAEQIKLEAFRSNDLEEQKAILRNVDKLFNHAGKENMLIESQHLSGVSVVNDTFDRNDFMLNCLNGVVDLHTGKLLEHNKNMMLSKITSANYVPDSEPTRFLQFLNEIFEGNQEIIHFLHKFFGYSLTGDCREQIMVILVGDGSNGKSVLLQIMNEIMGDYSAVSKPDLLIDKKVQGSNLSEVARLKGIRFCVVNELKMGDRLDESGVKDLTSGNNKIVARFLYGNEFEFYLKAKIALATNYEPKILGVDNGIWRRMVKIPFNRIFTGREIDKTLIDKLRAEKDAILGWLVKGCLLWQSEGLDLPQCLITEKDTYRKENDVIQQWIDEYCEIDSRYTERATTLYESFKSYCIKFNEYPMSQTLFGRNFGKKYRKTRTGGRILYEGIRVKYNGN